MSAATWAPRLVVALRRRNLVHSELAKLLGVSVPVLCERIATMGDLVDSRYDKKAGEIRCRLTKDAERVEAYLTSVGHKPVASRSRFAAARLDPTRHIHILEDDESYSPRLHRAAPARDPLVSALFGSGAQA